jgi:hypothetical protein
MLQAQISSLENPTSRLASRRRRLSRARAGDANCAGKFPAGAPQTHRRDLLFRRLQKSETGPTVEIQLGRVEKLLEAGP